MSCPQGRGFEFLRTPVISSATPDIGDRDMRKTKLLSAASLSACMAAAGLSLGVASTAAAQTTQAPATELDTLIVTAT